MKITFAILGMFSDKLKVPNHEDRKFAWNWKESELLKIKFTAKGWMWGKEFFKNNKSQAQFFFSPQLWKENNKALIEYTFIDWIKFKIFKHKQAAALWDFHSKAKE